MFNVCQEELRLSAPSRLERLIRATHASFRYRTGAGISRWQSTSIGPGPWFPKSLRACDGLFWRIRKIPSLQKITQIVRILPPPPAWMIPDWYMQPPRCFNDAARRERRLDLGCAMRNVCEACATIYSFKTVICTPSILSSKLRP
jgi:hypothetical protein